MSFWDKKEAKKIFQKFPFYNALLENPKPKHLLNIESLHEFPFYICILKIHPERITKVDKND